MWWAQTSRTYSAQLAHQPLAQPLPLGSPDPQAVQLHWGPLTLASDYDPADTIELELTIDGHLAPWTSRPR